MKTWKEISWSPFKSLVRVIMAVWWKQKESDSSRVRHIFSLSFICLVEWKVLLIKWSYDILIIHRGSWIRKISAPINVLSFADGFVFASCLAFAARHGLEGHYFFKWKYKSLSFAGFHNWHIIKSISLHFRKCIISYSTWNKVNTGDSSREIKYLFLVSSFHIPHLGVCDIIFPNTWLLNLFSSLFFFHFFLSLCSFLSFISVTC